jgi:hypothetical protein
VGRAKVRLGAAHWITRQFVACFHAMHRPFARLIRQLSPTPSTEEPQLRTRPALVIRLHEHICPKHAHNSLHSATIAKASQLTVYSVFFYHISNHVILSSIHSPLWLRELQPGSGRGEQGCSYCRGLGTTSSTHQELVRG